MATSNIPESWQQKVLLHIQQENASAGIDFDAYISEITAVGVGGRPVDFQELINSGYLATIRAEEPLEITMKGRFVGARGTTTGASILKLFYGEISYTSAGYYMITSQTFVRKRYRITLLWTDDTSITSAISQVPNDKNGERYVFAHGYLTVNNITFTDKVMEAEITFRFCPRDRNGSANYLFEDNVGCAAALPAISSTYTSTTKW